MEMLKWQFQQQQHQLRDDYKKNMDRGQVKQVLGLVIEDEKDDIHGDEIMKWIENAGNNLKH